MSTNRYRWATPGDVNAFFGLMLDNIADLVLTVSLLSGVFAFPTEFALRYMVPGTAIGVLVGDLLFFWMALSLARRTGQVNVTAMPLGLDTPSTFGMVFFVLGPAYLKARVTLPELEAAIHTWHIGICAIFLSGLFKFACAVASHSIRRWTPRAGLLGSLAAVALVLISFLPLVETLHFPVVGLVSLAVILTSLVARLPLPRKIPGALGGLFVGGLLYYGMSWTGLLDSHQAGGLDPAKGLLPYEWMTVFRFEWLGALNESLQYLPIVIPFALGTVVGGIDCTESAAAAGDEFDTGRVIGVEAFATLVASVCGGVVQTTPYIGHPAYKAMGGRAAYTLATALFIGGAGLIGYFGYIYAIVPKAAVFPILVFVGLEITAQSFHATPKRHYAAVALACVPALAALAMIYVDKLLGEVAAQKLNLSIAGALKAELDTLRILSNGFVVTSLLWASSLAALIDRRFVRAASYVAIAGVAAFFGMIHSPLPGAALFVPWQLSPDLSHVPYHYASGYLLVAGVLLAWGFWWQRAHGGEASSPEELWE